MIEMTVEERDRLLAEFDAAVAAMREEHARMYISADEWLREQLSKELAKLKEKGVDPFWFMR